MTDSHAALARNESHEATYKTPYEQFLDACEARLGHSLDGTQWIDGYSLDGARDFYQENHPYRLDHGNNLVDDYVRNVFMDKALVATGRYITLLSSKSMKADSDDGEQRRWDEGVFYVGTATDKQVAEYMEERYGREHCQHAHDCCGHWYASSADYKRHGVLVVLKQFYYQNI